LIKENLALEASKFDKLSSKRILKYYSLFLAIKGIFFSVIFHFGKKEKEKTLTKIIERIRNDFTLQKNINFLL